MGSSLNPPPTNVWAAIAGCCLWWCGSQSRSAPPLPLELSFRSASGLRGGGGIHRDNCEHILLLKNYKNSVSFGDKICFLRLWGTTTPSPPPGSASAWMSRNELITIIQHNWCWIGLCRARILQIFFYRRKRYSVDENEPFSSVFMYISPNVYRIIRYFGISVQ